MKDTGITEGRRYINKYKESNILGSIDFNHELLVGEERLEKMLNEFADQQTKELKAQRDELIKALENVMIVTFEAETRELAQETLNKIKGE
jgi:type II secretory pathway component PulF